MVLQRRSPSKRSVLTFNLVRGWLLANTIQTVCTCNIYTRRFEVEVQPVITVAVFCTTVGDVAAEDNAPTFWNNNHEMAYIKEDS